MQENDNGTRKQLERALRDGESPFKVTLFDRIMLNIVGYSVLWLIIYGIINAINKD